MQSAAFSAVTRTLAHALNQISNSEPVAIVIMVIPCAQTDAAAEVEAVDEPADREGIDGLVVDVATHRVTWRGTAIPVTPQEFRLLATLAAERGRVYAFQELTEKVWETDFYTGPSPLRCAIQRLRKKLDAFDAGVQIESVRGVGFTLVDRSPSNHAADPSNDQANIQAYAGSNRAPGGHPGGHPGATPDGRRNGTE